MDKFYITTPIYYVNGKPHIGHAYTTVVADVLARWRAAQGMEVVFSTGVDENSQKTVDAAKKEGEEIQPYLDRMAEIWEAAWRKLGISNTDFMRTTEDRHLETVREFWKRMDAAGDLYRGKYEGLYCKGHESFLKEDELTPEGLCPDHATKPEFVSEENYYFRLSRYQKPLMDLYAAHGDFVAPARRFSEVKSFVENGLEDVSFSREGREWGIPVPDDPHQSIYVWADALVSYATGAGGIEGWEEHPADIHAVGKDILRFHAVIWPAMLMSAGLPLPGQIIANGFLTAGGVKMGKSLGNAVDPLALAERYGADALRYFLLRETPYGEDGDFSEEKLRERYNGDLANGLGNFAARVLALAEKEELAPAETDDGFGQAIAEMRRAAAEKTGEFRFGDALAAVWKAIAFGDRYINEKKVWEIKDPAERRRALSNLAALLEGAAETLDPFLPSTSAKIKEAFIRDGAVLRARKIPALFPRIA